MIKVILSYLKERNSNWKAEVISDYIKDGEKVLDFGCGDLSLSKSVQKKLQKTRITGVDVIDFKKYEDKKKNIKFIKYDGKILPFKANSFDVVISFYVFHHCESAKDALRECVRVSRKKVIFVEPVPRYPMEAYFMGFMDWFYNLWKRESINFTYQFYSFDKWINIVKEFSVKDISKKELKTFASVIPVGKAYVFEIHK